MNFESFNDKPKENKGSKPEVKEEKGIAGAIKKEKEIIKALNFMIEDGIDFLWRNPDVELDTLTKDMKESLGRINLHNWHELRHKFYEKLVKEEKIEAKAKAAEKILDNLFGEYITFDEN